MNYRGRYLHPSLISPLYFLLSILYRIHLTGCDHRLMKHAEGHFLAFLYSQNMYFSVTAGAIVTDTWNKVAFRMLSECSRLFTSCTFRTHGLAEPHIRSRCSRLKRIFHFQWPLLCNTSLNPFLDIDINMCTLWNELRTTEISQPLVQVQESYCLVGGLVQAFTSSMVLAQARVYCQRWDTMKNS